MSCLLRVEGVEFDIDEFIARSGLSARNCRVFRKGAAMFPVTQPNGRVEEVSRVNIKVSTAKSDDLQSQIKDAIAFLQENKQEIESLCGYAGVEFAGLDFAVDLPDELDSNFFPPELLNLAGGLGLSVELTYY
jgi:hypothetical protein